VNQQSRDPKGYPVEPYKLTNKMKGWLQKANKIQHVSKMIKAKEILVQRDKMALFQALQQHAAQMPNMKVNEVDGMEFE